MIIPSCEIKIADYKCFGVAQGFGVIKPVNVLIGRNNSGKSSLLEAVEFATQNRVPPGPTHRESGKPQVIFSCSLETACLPSTILEDFATRVVKGDTTVPEKLKFQCSLAGDDITILEHNLGEKYSMDAKESLRQIANPFATRVLRKLAPDRDILPEPDKGDPRQAQIPIDEHGAGATNVMQYFMTQSDLPRELVIEKILGELNTIMKPDATFLEIAQRKHMPQGLWEIYLREAGKGSIGLSHMGSGVKSILLVLASLYLVPHLQGKKLCEYIFCFEELENNLHPSLQRRLLSYLREKAVEEHCIFFLTAHSSVPIDLFWNDENAQILHLRYDAEQSVVEPVSGYVQASKVLSNLGLRASDLLQSNGLIWLEGPSDRSYFNRWIELWADGQLREGMHYQCVFYGGKVKSHFSFDDPTRNGERLIQALKINRNAIVLMDSDRRSANDSIDDATQRICSEMEAIGGKAWVTAGREIENYIPPRILANVYRTPQCLPLDLYQDFGEYLESLKPAEGSRFESDKVRYARTICPHLSRHDLEETLDLTEQLKDVCDRIRSWNGIGSTG